MDREAGARPAVSPFGEVVNPGRVWSSKRHAKFFWTEIPVASNLCPCSSDRNPKMEWACALFRGSP